MPKIIVHRIGTMVNAISNYSLRIDGQQQPDKIGNGAIKEFQLPAGHHAISLRSIWFESRPYEFNIGENEVKTFNVKIASEMQVITIILSVLVVLVFNWKYILQRLPLPW